MDKRAKKRIAGLRTKIETLRRKHAGASAQEDTPGEAKKLEDEIAECLAEIAKLKKG